jgi:hypothetical protein
MKTKLYFAYGANMHVGYMRQNCPTIETGPAAIACKKIELQNWELKFYSHATVVSNPNASVPGILWRITEECELLLDAYESYPDYYTKRNWQQDGLEFFFYEMTPEFYKGKPAYKYVANMIESYNKWDIDPGPLMEVLNETTHRPSDQL